MKSTKRSIIRQKTPKNQVVVKSLSESNCKRFRQIAIRENFNLKSEKHLNKNVVPKTKATITINTTKLKRSCNQFLSIMSEPYLRTKSMNSMHIRKFKCLSSFRRPQTHVRNAQGHQRAVASTGSFDIIETTIITVYEVESQKTVNTKLGKPTIWFSAVIREFNHYFQRNPKKGRHKKIEGEN